MRHPVDELNIVGYKHTWLCSSPDFPYHPEGSKVPETMSEHVNSLLRQVTEGTKGNEHEPVLCAFDKFGKITVGKWLGR